LRARGCGDPGQAAHDRPGDPQQRPGRRHRHCARADKADLLREYRCCDLVDRPLHPGAEPWQQDETAGHQPDQHRDPGRQSDQVAYRDQPE